MDLYRRIAELTLATPADPEATEHALRGVGRAARQGLIVGEER